MIVLKKKKNSYVRMLLPLLLLLEILTINITLPILFIQCLFHVGYHPRSFPLNILISFTKSQGYMQCHHHGMRAMGWEITSVLLSTPCVLGALLMA